MNELRIRFACKTLEENIFLFACLFYLFSWLKRWNPMYAVLLCALYWGIRFRNASIYLVLILFFMSFVKIPYERTYYRVQELHQNYIVFKKGNGRYLYYTKDVYFYDDVYEIDGSIKSIESTKGFYQFDFGSYCREENIQYELLPTSIVIKKEGFSLRGQLQHYLYSHFSEADREIYLRLLFGIKSDAFGEDSFLNVSGFRMTGFLAILTRLFSRMKKRKRDQCLLIIHLFFVFFYHFPLLLTQSLIHRIFRMKIKSSMNCLGWSMFLSLFLFPESINRISFIYPFGLRICTLFYRETPLIRYLFLLFAQSIFFHYMNPLELLVFRPLYMVSGIFILLAWGTILFPFSFHSIFYFMNDVTRWINMFRMPGSILGFGFLFYLLILSLVPKNRRLTYALGFLLVFQYFGLFHPFGEVSFINIGQGDSILVRAPFNTYNILIDTGKPNKQNTLDTYLKSLGIHQIDTLIITHQDDDHSGNQEFVREKYRVQNVVDAHIESQRFHVFEFYDLNTIDNEDENESSIVNYFHFHGLSYLLMADANERTEREIVKNYPNLEVDVLKIGHHGSKTSSSDYFLQHIHPSMGIFSCGNYRMYHHPNHEVVARFEQYRIPTLSTFEEGDIRILSLFHWNLLITSTFRFAVI